MSGIHLGTTSTTTYSHGELHRVDIQVLIRQGLPKLDIVGLPQNVIREGSNRILSALHLLGFSFKSQKILVSLNPADLKKEGSHFDLPILVAILKAMNIIENSLDTSFYWGELNLDGSLRPFESFLAHLLYVQSFKMRELRAPLGDDDIRFLEPYLPKSVKPIQHIQNLLESSPQNSIAASSVVTTREDPEVIQTKLNDLWLAQNDSQASWSSLSGHPTQFEIFAVAAVGRLHLLLEGLPGIGKTYWAQAYRDIQLPLPYHLWAERARFYANANRPLSTSDLIMRPFIRPHHQSSSASVVGSLQAGFITEAHGGCLFLDEMPEFRRDVLEALREPLESKSMTLGRSHSTKNYAADIQLLATMNPCPCGRRGGKKRCFCSSTRQDLYQSRISQPLRDRFHLHLWWTHTNQKASDEWSLQHVKERLLRAQNVVVKNLPTDIVAESESPRRQKLLSEVFRSWCQWHEIESPSTLDLDNFRQFLSFFKEPEERKTHERFL